MVPALMLKDMQMVVAIAIGTWGNPSWATNAQGSQHLLVVCQRTDLSWIIAIMLARQRNSVIVNDDDKSTLFSQNISTFPSFGDLGENPVFLSPEKLIEYRF